MKSVSRVCRWPACSQFAYLIPAFDAIKSSVGPHSTTATGDHSITRRRLDFRQREENSGAFRQLSSRFPPVHRRNRPRRIGWSVRPLCLLVINALVVAQFQPLAYSRSANRVRLTSRVVKSGIYTSGFYLRFTSSSGKV